MLKRPDTYGKEITNPEDPSNGWLELTGGNQDPLGISQLEERFRSRRLHSISLHYVTWCLSI